MSVALSGSYAGRLPVNVISSFSVKVLPDATGGILEEVTFRFTVAIFDSKAVSSMSLKVNESAQE